LERPQRIEVSSSDAPFRKYSLCWSLDALSAAECRISIEADMELQSRMIQHVVDRLLPGNISEIIASFEARACALYGG
jgi:ribosome-associated toxin RatA of RatAB toxin-antitoxin module